MSARAGTQESGDGLGTGPGLKGHYLVRKLRDQSIE